MEPGQHGFVDFLRPLMRRKDEYFGEVFVSGFNMLLGFLRYSPDEDSCASMASGHWTKTCPFLTMFSDLVIQKGI